jgi:hypothetical protein
LENSVFSRREPKSEPIGTEIIAQFTLLPIVSKLGIVFFNSL